jgi:hypothetical protein
VKLSSRWSAAAIARGEAAIEQHSVKFLEDLANMQDEGTAYFQKKWGERFDLRLYRYEDRYKRNDDKDSRDLLRVRDELRRLWPGHIDRRTLMVMYQSSDPEEKILAGWLRRAGQTTTQVRWTSKLKAIRPNPRSLEASLVFACIQYADLLRYCRNPKCASPYFIATRTDQKYCTEVCGLYGKRMAKRKWWKENRAKE